MQRVPEPEYMDLPDEAEAYARADFAEVNAAFVGRLLEVVGDLERARAVDLGTGPADIPLRVLTVRPGWHVTAVDASEAMLAHGREAARQAGASDRVDLILADAQALPLPDGVFDVVFSNSILHHVRDAAVFWREVKRIAAPGAVIFLRDLLRPSDEAAARKIVADNAGEESALLQEEFYRSLLAAYTVDEVRAQLQAAGLSNLHVEQVTDRHLDAWGRIEK